MEIGRHWNDGINLGARARFDENSKPEPVLWIESLRDSDQGTYRCRVDFKQAPTKNFKINLNVIGKLIILKTIFHVHLFFIKHIPFGVGDVINFFFHVQFLG